MFGHWHGFAWFGVLPRLRSRQFPQRQCFWRLVISPRAYKTDRPLRYRFRFLPFLPHLTRLALVPSRIVSNLEKTCNIILQNPRSVIGAIEKSALHKGATVQ